MFFWYRDIRFSLSRNLNDFKRVFLRTGGRKRAGGDEDAEEDKSRDLDRHGTGTCLRVMMMGSELILTGAFLGTGLLAYVIIPGLLVMWDQVLYHMEDSNNPK
jgi:hypothetical protein